MERKAIAASKHWNTALDNFRKGVAASGKERKRLLNASFDAQVAISKELKTPLYDIGCLIRSNA